MRLPLRYASLSVSLLLLFSLVPQPIAAQHHQKLIVTRPASSPGAYSRVKTYADRLRQELGRENVQLICSGEGYKALEYRVYQALADTSIDSRLRQEVGYAPDFRRDSLLAYFGQRSPHFDSLFRAADERGNWLIVNRYQVNGQVAFTTSETAPPAGRSGYFAREQLAIDRFLGEPIITIDTTASAHCGYFGPSAYAAVFHAFQQDASGAAISIFAPYRAESELRQGVHSLSDMLAQLSGSSKRLVTVRLTGHQLKAYLEYNAGIRFFRLRGPDSDLLRPLRYPAADIGGVRYRIDLTRPAGSRVTIYELQNGDPFDPDKRYTVALDSFLARRFERQGIAVTPVHADYHVAWAAWLLEHRTLSLRAADNWSAAPERWVRAIAQRESRHLWGR